MIVRFAADLVMVAHFAFIVFVALGGFLVLKWWRLAIFHIPCVFWGVMIEFRGWICPLTPLENYLRKSAGGTGYHGGFIDHYIMPIVYPEGLTRQMQVYLGIVVLALNLSVYGVLLITRAARRRRGLSRA